MVRDIIKHYWIDSENELARMVLNHIEFGEKRLNNGCVSQANFRDTFLIPFLTETSKNKDNAENEMPVNRRFSQDSTPQTGVK